MNKPLPAVVLAACLSTISIPAAHADDYDSDAHSEWQDIRRDRSQIRADARHVNEERGELESARRQQWQSWWNGDYWGAHRASEHAREEARELRAARQKLHRDVDDVRRDRAELYFDEPRHSQWWGRRWFGGDDD